MSKKKKWLKFRHRAIRWVGLPFMNLYTRLRYRIRVQKHKEKRPYFIMMNHQTAFDQFFVEMAFSGPVYYVASEDLFSKGWISSVIRYVVAPIPIKKQVTDVNAVMNCIRVAREGGTIAIAPEGNRTYSGRTEYMNPAIAPLAKKLKLPIALFRIEGGYGVHPRWSDVVRKGKMRAYVSRVIEPEEYAAMSNEELLRAIQKELYVDEGVADGIFESAKKAEYLERAFYVCPHCGLSTFHSAGNEIECLKCHRKIAYGADKSLTGVGFAFPFRFTTQWYDYQEAFINKLDVMQYCDEPLYRERSGLTEIEVYKSRSLLRENAEIALYGDRLVVDAGAENEMVLPFSQITAMSVLGRNKLNIYWEDHVYQLKSDKRFNALKYVNIYFRHRNMVRGEENAEFLGL